MGRGEREGYGEPCDVTSLSLSLNGRSYRGRLLEIKLTSADETRALIVHDTPEDSADGLGGLSVQIDRTSVNATIAKTPTIHHHQSS